MHIALCRYTLSQGRAIAADSLVAYATVPPPARAEGVDSGPTPYTTGLGLPLSRALARAGNGWLGLDDDVGALLGCGARQLQLVLGFALWEWL